MDWIKAHYDRILLAALGIAAAACAAIIILQALSFEETFENRTSPKPPDNTIPEPPTERIKQEAESIAKPASWTPRESSLFVSRPYVLKDGELINPLEGGTPLHPPVPNEWLVRYGLDWARGDVLDADPDGDGFSNLEEFLGGTDPTDPASKPSYTTKLRLKEFVQVPFRLKFSGSPDGGETFAINTLDLRQPTQFLSIGDPIPNTPYRVLTFEEKFEDRGGFQGDVSELTIENTETGEKVVLIYDREVNSPTAFADFRNLWDGAEFRVRLTDDFSFAPEENVRYKLVDISATEAVIQAVETGQEHRIPAEN